MIFICVQYQIREIIPNPLQYCKFQINPGLSKWPNQKKDFIKHKTNFSIHSKIHELVFTHEVHILEGLAQNVQGVLTGNKLSMGWTLYRLIHTTNLNYASFWATHFLCLRSSPPLWSWELVLEKNEWININKNRNSFEKKNTSTALSSIYSLSMSHYAAKIHRFPPSPSSRVIMQQHLTNSQV